MRAALRAINLVQVREREFELRRERLDLGPDGAGRQRGKLVEERLDEGRENGREEELDDDAEESRGGGLPTARVKDGAQAMTHRNSMR